MQQLQQQNVRPISTYDNLSASAASNNTAKPKVKQQQQPQRAGESSGQLAAATPQPQSESQSTAQSTSASQSADNENSSLLCDSNSNGIEIIPTQCTKSTMDLNETSHSIAAVRAALSDAKSKFFGINNFEQTPAESDRNITPPPPKTKSRPPPPPPTSTSTSTSEPKYQNVPQPAALRMPHSSSVPVSTPKSMSPERSLRYGTTYEQIPLSDLDAPQPSQVSYLYIVPYIIYKKFYSPQAVYMSTTVPQNMKGMKIAGRHTPTRNSLRHSRMIVVNNKPHDSELPYHTIHNK